MDIIDITSNEYSNRVLHKSKVDFNQHIIVKPVFLVQYDDKLPIIEVLLQKNGVDYVLPTDAIVDILWGKPDHTYVRKHVLGCDTTRTKVYFEVDENMSYFFGMHNPIIELKINGKTAGSSYIPIDISRNPIQKTDIESHIEDTDLDEVLAQTKQYRDETAQYYESVQEASETAITNIETAAQEAEQTVSQAINLFEIGTEKQTTPSADLVVGGIFYEKL